MRRSAAWFAGIIGVAAALAAPAAGHPPALGLIPSNMTVEATQPAGANVAYAAPTATHSGAAVPVTCTPPPGSLFPFGTTKVTCSAQDPDTKETSSGSFNVAVVDTSPPEFSGASDAIVEANERAGALLNYNLPVATDRVDGVRPVTCTPAPGSHFKFGDTTVSCKAADIRGNSATRTYKVTVRDTKPPEFSDFEEEIVQETNGPGPVRVKYKKPSASDAADGARGVNCLPAPNKLFRLGSTTVACTAADTHGNVAAVSFGVEVVDTTPPPSLTGVQAKTAARSAILTWQLPAGPDVKGVELVRTPGRDGEAKTVVFRGRASTFTDRGLTPDATYRYTATTYDFAGNRGKSVNVVVPLKTSALLSPPDGAELTTLPLLRWRAVTKASYYNVQLYRGTKKILSIWPTLPRLRLSPTWTYNGVEYDLTAGTYRWYVWPGFGALRLARYGSLLGQSTFKVLVAPG
jgi:hypothetical protein